MPAGSLKLPVLSKCTVCEAGVSIRSPFIFLIVFVLNLKSSITTSPVPFALSSKFVFESVVVI